MKKTILFIGLALVLTAAIYSQTATLDIAIFGAKNYIEGRLPQKMQLLIADPAAPTSQLGAYAAEELSTRLVNGNRITLVERSAAVMQTLRAESSYQLSGDVSDATVQSIGHQTGAEAIVTGSISGMGERYRLNIKITSVKTAELLGQYSIFFQPDTVLNALLAENRPARVKPRWIDAPLSSRGEYEQGASGISQYYYDVGISNMAASEQLARTRARQNVQQVIAANIASDIRARIDITEFSMFSSSSIEDVETRFESVLTNSIRTRVPAFEVLEWYVEKGTTGGRDWYIAYVLVRLPRQGIISVVERVEPAAVADNAIRQLQVNVITGERDKLVKEMQEAIDYSLEMIREGFGR